MLVRFVRAGGKDRVLFRNRYGVALGIVMIVSSATAEADMTVVEGHVTKIRDGDTIEIGPIAIRLNGVSAPEIGEALGKQSKAFIYRLIMGKRIRCELNGEKTYDRLVGKCFFQGQDIGAELISSGLALDCPRYSDGQYKVYERTIAREQIELPAYCRLMPNNQD